MLLAGTGCVEDNTADPEPTPDTGPGSDMAPMPDTAPEPDGAPEPEPDMAPEPEPDMAPEPEPDMAVEPECAGDETRDCDIEGGCVGTQTCADGVFGDCAPPEEVCNDADDDCDGEVDEGLQCTCPVTLPPAIVLPADPQDFVAEQDVGAAGWGDGGGDAFDDYGLITLRANGESLTLDMSLGVRQGTVGGVDFELDSAIEGNLWTVTVSPVDGGAAGPLDAYVDGDLGSDEGTVPEMFYGQGLPVLRTVDDVEEPGDPPVFTAFVTGDLNQQSQLVWFTAEGSEQVAIVAEGIELPFTLAVAPTFADPQGVADAFGAGFLGMCVEAAGELCGTTFDDDGNGDADCADVACADAPACDGGDGALRLVDGPDAASGRLEIRYRGVWATICDDGWSEQQGLLNGDVACRELGFPLGAAEVGLEGPEGVGPIALDDVECAGDEARLVDCPADPLGVHNCSHSEDIHVRCLQEGECRDDAGCPEGEACVDFGCIVPPDEICDDGEDNDLDGEADCDDPDCAEAAPCNIPPGPPMTAFVTSDTHAGNLGGLAGADAICNARADAAGLPGRYLAWLANDEGNPAGRFGRNDGPYVRVDGVEIAADWDDLVDGAIAAPLAIDETGAAVEHNALNGWAWTAAASDGSGPVGSNCDNWRGSGQGSKGNTNVVDQNWARNGNPSNFNCDAQRGRVYCFQQP